jgi:uncharacterized membrane protein
MSNTKVVVERQITASAERVWEVLTNLEGMPTTLSGVSRVEVLTKGPFATGTRWRETRRMFGKEATEEMYVTACEPPSRYVVEADSHGAHYVSEFTVSADGRNDRPDTTTVRMTFSATPPGGFQGLLAKLLGGVGARAVAKAITQDLTDVAAAAQREAMAGNTAEHPADKTDNTVDPN